jgi:hypothetical protein
MFIKVDFSTKNVSAKTRDVKGYCLKISKNNLIIFTNNQLYDGMPAV